MVKTPIDIQSAFLRPNKRNRRYYTNAYCIITIYGRIALPSAVDVSHAPKNEPNFSRRKHFETWQNLSTYV